MSQDTTTQDIHTPRTYADALASGWTVWYRSLSRYYTSRRCDLGAARVQSGTARCWAGLRRYWVEHPNYRSTRYGTVRVYLRPPVAPCTSR